MGIGFPGDSLKQAKAKYRDLSTAAAKAPPSVEMTCGWGAKDGSGRDDVWVRKRRLWSR